MSLNQKMVTLHQPRAALFAGAMLLAAIAVGCGSGDDDVPPASTTRRASATTTRSPAGATTAVTRTPAASTTPTQPPATATPSPTERPSPTPVPTPVKLTFDSPDSWDGTMTPPSKGPFGVVYAQSNIAYFIARPNRVEVWAVVNVGINEHPAASAWLYNTFTAPGAGVTPITARISTAANWKGILAGNGAAGTRAGVTISLSVLEGGKVLTTKSMHSLERSASTLTAGGFDDERRKEVEMDVSLLPGHEYELRLTAKCEARSGVLPATASCVYGAREGVDKAFVEWEFRRITFEP